MLDPTTIDDYLSTITAEHLEQFLDGLRQHDRDQALAVHEFLMMDRVIARGECLSDTEIARYTEIIQRWLPALVHIMGKLDELHAWTTLCEQAEPAVQTLEQIIHRQRITAIESDIGEMKTSDDNKAKHLLLRRTLYIALEFLSIQLDYIKLLGGDATSQVLVESFMAAHSDPNHWIPRG